MKFRSNFLLLLFLSGLSFVTGSQSMAGEPPSPNGERSQNLAADRYATMVATGHLEVLRAFSDGLGYDTQELPSAAQFFLQVSGIAIRWDVNGALAKPSSDTKSDVRAVQNFLKQNGRRLRWDEDLGRVVLVSTDWAPTEKAKWEKIHRLGVAFWRRQIRNIEQFMTLGGNRLAFECGSEVLTELTTIPVDWSATYLGVMPTPQTRVNLEQLRSWFEKNCSALYWDESDGVLRIRAERPNEPDPLCTKP